MSPRPRKVTDEEVFEAAVRVMGRVSPNQLTLAEIAGEAGVTAGALVQRFGSKRALMVELFGRLAAGTDDQFAALREAHESPLNTLFAWADCLAAMGSSPATLAHHLGYLQMDLTDPDLLRHASEQARRTREGIEMLLAEAVSTGELKKRTDIAELARAVELTVTGSLMTWAFYRERSSIEWVRHDLDRLLNAYRRPPQ